MNLFRGRPRLEYGEVDRTHVVADDSSIGSNLETKDQFFIRIRPKRYFRSDASTVSSITYHDGSGYAESAWCCHTSRCIPEPRTKSTKIIARKDHKKECNECYNCNTCRTANKITTDGDNLVANGSTERRKTKENDSDTVPTRETASLFDNLSSTSEDDDDEVQRIRGAPSRRRKWRLISNISGKKKNRRKSEVAHNGIQTEILS
jgi:hypothetical protein